MRKLELSDVFQISFETDVEGRGPTNTIGYFLNESDAEKAAKGIGSWGANGRVSRTSVSVVVYETYEEYKQAAEQNIRKRALDKLTYEEAKALGIVKP